MNRRDLAVAALLALGAFGVYALTLARDVLPGDSGEFQLAVPLLGIVHPTGYPLYLLLAKLFTLLPSGGTLAWRVNLFSAASAAAAVGAFYLLGLRVGALVSSARSHALAIATAAITLMLAFSPTFWLQATEAEVYALNAVFVCVLLGLSIQLRESPSFRLGTHTREWLWVALALGLSLAHHRTTILLAPVLALYLFPYRGLRAVWKGALVLGVLPLLLYFYTPLRYDASPYLQTQLDDQHVIVSLEPTPQAFVAHFLGSSFRGALSWDGRSLERLGGALPRIGLEFTLAGLLLAMLGVIVLLRVRRLRLAGLLLAAACVYTLFNALYQIGDISDFYTPLYILTACLAAAGAAGLVHWALQRSLHRAWAAPLLLLPAVLLLGDFASAQTAHDSGVRARWQALLAPALPGGAILISNDRDDMTPLLYLQFVEGVRTDVAGLFPLIASEPQYAHVVPLTQTALRTARPVYFIKPMEGLAIMFRLQPEGPLVHVLGVQDAGPQVSLTRDSLVTRLVGWSRAGGSDPADPPSITLYWQPLGAVRRDFKTYVHVDSAAGKTLAQSDHTPGGAFYPPSAWQAGDTLHDTHSLPLPSDFSPGDYGLVAGAYYPDGQAIDGVGRIELGTLTIGK